jgi:hypothetical protein
LTFAALADTTAAVASQFMYVGGALSTQIIEITEINIVGLAAAAAVSFMQWARCSTLPVTPAALTAPNTDGPMHPATVALVNPPVVCVSATTQPQRSANITDARLALNVNLFGGVMRWNAGPDQKWSMVGNTQPLGGCILSAYTGSTSGAASSHIMYEPY